MSTNTNTSQWYLFKNFVYKIEPNSEYAQSLRTESIYLIPRVPMFTEVIRGHSMILRFGAYMEKYRPEFIEEILRKGECVPEEFIEKRMRYSHTDGGEHFDSYRTRFKELISSIKKKLRKLWVG